MAAVGEEAGGTGSGGDWTAAGTLIATPAVTPAAPRRLRGEQVVSKATPKGWQPVQIAWPGGGGPTTSPLKGGTGRGKECVGDACREEQEEPTKGPGTRESLQVSRAAPGRSRWSSSESLQSGRKSLQRSRESVQCEDSLQSGRKSLQRSWQSPLSSSRSPWSGRESPERSRATGRSRSRGSPQKWGKRDSAHRAPRGRPSGGSEKPERKGGKSQEKGGEESREEGRSPKGRQ